MSLLESIVSTWNRQIKQAKKVKDLEKENTRLKKLVADLSLDNSILKEAAEGNF